jgi:hypothetical protein
MRFNRAWSLLPLTAALLMAGAAQLGTAQAQHPPPSAPLPSNISPTTPPETNAPPPGGMDEMMRGMNGDQQNGATLGAKGMMQGSIMPGPMMDKMMMNQIMMNQMIIMHQLMMMDEMMVKQMGTMMHSPAGMMQHSGMTGHPTSESNH